MATTISVHRLATLALLLAAAATACGGSRPPGGRPTVAATVAPHSWLVAEIAGDDATVLTVLPPTADPHSHMPTDVEVTRLARCQILFRAGVPSENGTWQRALASRGVQLVDLTEGLDLLGDSHGHRTDHGGDRHDDEHESRSFDPHTWTSPRRLARQAVTVTTALAELLPGRREAIRRRGREVVARLVALDADLARRLAPLRGRSFYVQHPSWSYFAADYGLVQVALEAGGSEPTDAQLTAWLRQARADGARVVFGQPQSAAQAPRALADTLGARFELLDPLAADAPAHMHHLADRLLAALAPDPLGAMATPDPQAGPASDSPR